MTEKLKPEDITMKDAIGRLRENEEHFRHLTAAWPTSATSVSVGRARLREHVADLRTLLAALDGDEVIQLGAALVAALDECEPHISNAFLMQAVRGRQYSGPTYDSELAAFREALAAKVGA